MRYFAFVWLYFHFEILIFCFFLLLQYRNVIKFILKMIYVYVGTRRTCLSLKFFQFLKYLFCVVTWRRSFCALIIWHLYVNFCLFEHSNVLKETRKSNQPKISHFFFFQNGTSCHHNFDTCKAIVGALFGIGRVTTWNLPPKNHLLIPHHYMIRCSFDLVHGMWSTLFY